MTDIHDHNDSNVDSSIFSKLSFLNAIIKCYYKMIYNSLVTWLIILLDGINDRLIRLLTLDGAFGTPVSCDEFQCRLGL